MLNPYSIAMYLRIRFQNSIYCINAILLQVFQLGEFPGSCWSWVEINGREWRSQPTAKFWDDFSATHQMSLLTDSNIRTVCVISWGELLADRCLRITLIGTSCHKIAAFQFLCDGCVCYTWYLAGVRISSLIAYILNLLSRPILGTAKQLRWKISLQHLGSSIFQFFPLQGKYCQKNK